MKHYIHFLAGLVFIILFDVSGSAQSMTASSLSATIVTPITIAKNTDMDFGNVSLNPSRVGQAHTKAPGKRVASSGMTISSTVEASCCATFTVSGQPGYTFDITLPASIMTKDDASHTMMVNSFKSTPTSTLANGVQTLSIGATLNVTPEQTPGLYTSATPFTVTVNYN